jgi:large subunit ribosomal protein L23
MDSAMTTLVDLVKYPVITEKSYVKLFLSRQYTFDVDIRLTKPQLKVLFERLFNVQVISLNTHIPPRKKLRVGRSIGRRPQYKRVILTLKKGQSLNFNLDPLLKSSFFILSRFLHATRRCRKTYKNKTIKFYFFHLT